MIFPIPEDLRPWQRHPLMWTLLLINILLFVVLFSGKERSLAREKIFSSESLSISGLLYHQYLESLPAKELEKHPSWVQEVRVSNESQRQLLGVYALRDGQFLSKSDEFPFVGDSIAIEDWLLQVREFRGSKLKQNLFKFGLNGPQSNGLSWFTYQFSHSNWMHLLSNMMFLIILGAAVESLVGSLGLIVIYLLGGIAGGLAFVAFNQHGGTPMVGASASISAIMAFYVFAETRARIRYFYFVSPLPGHHGAIYLPTLLMVPLFLVVDFASLLSTPEGLGASVAYSAHVGGATWGALTGLLYRLLKKNSLSAMS